MATDISSDSCSHTGGLPGANPLVHIVSAYFCQFPCLPVKHQAPLLSHMYKPLHGKKGLNSG